MSGLKDGLFLGNLHRLMPLILWLTSTVAASYGNVGIYEFKKVTTVRVALSPPASLSLQGNSAAAYPEISETCPFSAI
jgi:hypothetical protein